MTPLIRALRAELRTMLSMPWPKYTVPGAWVGNDEPVVFPSAPAYFLHQLQVIDRDERIRHHRPWSTSHALAYNAMVRHVTSYNHGPGVVETGWKNTGTLLKLVALLPYLVRMDVDTLVLLPITEIGTVGKKGTHGSPYAVRHPWHIDPNLIETNLSFNAEDQARILVEACHALGIRVVLETVLRTASVDSAIAQTHPEWFYWVDEAKVAALPSGFTAPQFSTETTQTIEEMVNNGDFEGLPQPPDTYKELFTAPPLRLEQDDQGWRGIAPKNRIVRIPGAFADWPVNDTQPEWTDVTYLCLHDHPQYRYVAYNTVRMYEQRLDVEENRARPLWNTIASLIPYYIRTLNIDGAMIDMGHALPAELRMLVMREARSLKKDFILFEENFDINERSANEGYDAAIGHLPLSASTVEDIRTFIRNRSANPSGVKYFGTPESHNTPRAASRWDNEEAVSAVWTVLRVLPGAIGFVHAGIELGEKRPVNTGLGFTSDELSSFTQDSLPLFSDVPLCWDKSSPVLQAIVRTSHMLHGTSFWEHAQPTDRLLCLDSVDTCIAFLRIPEGSRQGLLCVANLSDAALRTRINIPADSGVMFLAPNVNVKRAGANIDVDLPPWGVELVFTLH